MQNPHQAEPLCPEKRQGLEAAGFRVGTAAEFLGLSPEKEAEAERRLSAFYAIVTATGFPLKSVLSLGFAPCSEDGHTFDILSTVNIEACPEMAEDAHEDTQECLQDAFPGEGRITHNFSGDVIVHYRIHDLTYASCQEAHKWDGLYARLGWSRELGNRMARLMGKP